MNKYMKSATCPKCDSNEAVMLNVGKGSCNCGHIWSINVDLREVEVMSYGENGDNVARKIEKISFKEGHVEIERGPNAKLRYILSNGNASFWHYTRGSGRIVATLISADITPTFEDAANFINILPKIDLSYASMPFHPYIISTTTGDPWEITTGTYIVNAHNKRDALSYWIEEHSIDSSESIVSIAEFEKQLGVIYNQSPMVE